MTDAGAWLKQGFALRDAQQTEEARAAIAKAAALAPKDARIAKANALIHFETWQPSVALFQVAQRLAPDDLFVTHSVAAALNAEGAPNESRTLLERTLATQPEWIDGHKLLTTLRTTAGGGADSARSFAAACKARPDNLALRLAWFHALSTSRDWEAARSVIADGEALLGKQRAFTVASIFLASESGDGADDPHLFDPVEEMQDAGLDLCRVRYHLRRDEADFAEAIAARHIGTAAERTFWPYLSLAWRLQGDSRAAWLDGELPYVDVTDLGMSATELGTLAGKLRALHTQQAPYPEQSVRGGTQTDRHLFFNPDPVIQHVKARITNAVRCYIQNLPPHVDGHPLLGQPRGECLYEGSWSVRLSAQGYHACHTHNRGWISSALYVSLPEPKLLGDGPAGWTSFGTPPPELGLALSPYTQIEPKPGRLVLFPSTMWHGTKPFDGGERLTIAFDVCLPRG